MVAVAPFLEESLTDRIDDTAQRFVYKLPVAPGLEGLGATKKDPLDNPAQAVDITHQTLSRVVALREVANRLLEGRRIYALVPPNGEARLLVDPPIRKDEAPPWSGLSGPWSGKALLSWVAKMQCPSYSLPAGAFENGGSCIAASQGQTTADKKNVENIVAKEAILRKTVGRVKELPTNALPLWYALSTCQTCYAEKETYAYFSNVLNALITLSWTEWAIATPSSSGSGETVFVETMIRAIEQADYRGSTPRDLEHLRVASRAHGLPEDRPYVRFFRWHDAGDVLSKRYMEQIKRVSDHFNPRKGGEGTPTLFWLPTRIWAVEAASKWASVNADPKTNIVLRPSAFHVNFPAPTPEVAGPGNAAGTTTIASDLADAYKARGVFDFDCPAAAETSDCRSEGCRACWVKPDLVINYRLH